MGAWILRVLWVEVDLVVRLGEASVGGENAVICLEKKREGQRLEYPALAFRPRERPVNPNSLRRSYPVAR